MAFLGGSSSGQQPTVYSGASRFHYTAVLANPNSGDVSELPARFYDKQTIPLVNSTEGYSVALSKLSIQGAAANLPLLLPPLRALSTGSEDVIKTGYTVGVRFRVEKGASSARTGTGTHAWTPMLTQSIDIPTIYPTANRADAASKFYWVTSLYDVMDAVNKGISDLVAGGSASGMTFTQSNYGASVWQDGNTGVRTVASLSDFVPTNGFALQDGRAPFAMTLDPQLQWYSMMSTEQCAADVDVPGYPRIGGTTFATDTYLTAYLYFNDKLLEAVPFDWLVDRTVPLTSATLQSENPDRVRSPAFNAAAVGSSYFYPLALSSTHARVTLPGALQQEGQAYSFGRNAAATTAIFSTPQENPAFDNWRPYTGFAITSGSIIAYPTTVAQNVVSSSGFAGASNSGTRINNILFEADVPGGKGAFALQNGTNYEPSVMQWKAIKAGSDLSSVDLQLYLRTRTGDYIPWMVTNGGTISIQLVFALVPW